MSSKYIDITMAVIMGFFAYTKFSNEQVGFGILFVVLCAMNIVTAVIKHKRGITTVRREENN